MYPLFAMTIAPMQVALVVMGCLLAWSLTKNFFAKDTAIEDRREKAVDLTASLKGLGLERLAGFARAYAVGDYSGLYNEMKTLAREVLNDGHGMALLTKSFFIQLPMRLKVDGDKERIYKVIDQHRAANPEVMIQDPMSGGVKPVAVRRESDPVAKVKPGEGPPAVPGA